MSAINKERIFEQLRNYHLQQFPATVKNLRVNEFRAEFGTIEDKVIGMLLKLVDGKEEFADSTSELNAFQDKINRHMPENGEDEESRNLFITKIGQLSGILTLAKESGFTLRSIKGFGTHLAKSRSGN